MNRAIIQTIQTIQTTLPTLLALLVMLAAPARAETDLVEWMANRLLSGKDILDYELALKRFVDLSDPRVLPTLMKLTEADDTIARAEAAGVLWYYNSKEVREKLVELSKDLDSEVRIEAAKSLCLMKYTASLEIIATELASAKQPIRSRALRALAAVGGDEARKAANGLRRSKSVIDRVWAAYALYRMDADRQAQLDELERHLLGFPKTAWLARKSDPDKADLGRAARLASADLEPRLAASSALSRIGDERALAVLVRGTADRAAFGEPDGALHQLLRHRNDAAVACAGGLASDRVLVRLGSAQTARRLRIESDAAKATLAEALGKAVGDRARLVRLAALRAIAKLGLASQMDRVVQAMRSSDSETRRAAALTLGGLGDDRRLESLTRALAKEKDNRVRRSLYRAVELMETPRAVDPMLAQLKKLYKQRRGSSRSAEEMPLCIAALASAGERSADKVLRMLPELKGDKRKLMIEVLARTGSANAIDFFMDVLRESAPHPDDPAVRFFDSLDGRFAPRLESLIESETGMWIRVILARALFRLGKQEYGRGILWGLKNEEVYYRRLAASAARGLKVPGSVEPLIELLGDEPETAWYAARSLMSDGSPRSVAGLIKGLESSSLRRRRQMPVQLFWEGQRSARNPFIKEVDNERVWVLFAEDRIGGKLDLFLTWSADGRTWTEPVFTGLTSFADSSGRVAPPTFSLKVRGRDITIALTRTFAQSNNPKKPRFKTLQRVHRLKLKDFFKDRDGDGLKDAEERSRFTNPGRRDSDGDGLVDGKDKNPLARPAPEGRDDDEIKVLAFSYALMVAEALAVDSRLLVVENTPGTRRAPELPTWPWLVLHLKPDQVNSLWRNTGGGFPRVRFGQTEFRRGRTRAMQPLELAKGPGDGKRLEVLFSKRGDQWIVVGCREAD